MECQRSSKSQRRSKGIFAHKLHRYTTNNRNFISTDRPTYWPADISRLSDLLDFFIASGISSSYINILPSYDLTSDHSLIISTVSTTIIARNSIPRLLNYKTNWELYIQIIQEKIDLSTKLKEHEEIKTQCDRLGQLL